MKKILLILGILLFVISIIAIVVIVRNNKFIDDEKNDRDRESKLLETKKILAKKTEINCTNFKVIEIPKLEIPKLKKREIVVNHKAFSLSYNEFHEQANWVAYELTEQETYAKNSRTNKFLEDYKIKTNTATKSDYYKSGFDRGHLAPAGDMAWSKISMLESFYYSNISPQKPQFNRGIWKKLETLVRIWAIENQSVYIVTGPVLTEKLEKIGENEVSVPNFFYKVILDYRTPEIKAIGFVIPNKKLKQPLHNFAVSIDSVEKITNIDFFPLLPDEQEIIIEKCLNLNYWSWN
jgi:endonuclease G